MGPVDVDRYLKRIGFEGELRLDAGCLEALQRAHMSTVPFENLDVFHRRGVSTDPRTAIYKIVERGRGGWCFELNGAFATLLDALGFSVITLGATVLVEEPHGPQPDHATIRVDLERPYLVDVGFGDSFFRPLPLDCQGPHDGGRAAFELEVRGEVTTLVMVGVNGTRSPQYRFVDEPRTWDAFEPSSLYLQTTPGLRWTQKRFATRLLDGGPDRVTLLHDRLEVRSAGQVTKTAVSSNDWAQELKTWFGIRT